MFGWLKQAAGFLFGSSSSGKGVVSEVSDVVDKWNPSETTKHKMDIEDLQAGDKSQENARSMQLKSHSTWFDSLVDGLNRLVRPVFSFWVFGILAGLIPIPASLLTIPPMLWNIIWTIVTFWFGSRLLFKDIPNMISWIKKFKQ